MIHVRPATHNDVADIAPRLRSADLREVSAGTGEPAQDVLAGGIAESDPCYAATDENGRVIGLFGVVPHLDQKDVGRIWLLGSEDLVQQSFHFARSSRVWIERLQKRYRVLWNWVDARNEVHIRWLKWCGFAMTAVDESYGAERRRFFEFQRIRETEN